MYTHSQSHRSAGLTANAADVFSDLFSEMVDHASAGLFWPDVFTITARAGFSNALRERLVWLFELVLYEDFAIYRSLSGRSTSPDQDQSDDTDLYARWFEGMTAGGGLEKMLTNRPMLDEHRDRILRQWCDNTEELVERFSTDQAELVKLGYLSDIAGRVMDVRSALSDPHNDGQTVSILTFESGERLVYKPRTLHVDTAMAALLERLGEKSPPVSLRVPNSLDCGAYGWAEFIDHTPLARQQDGQIFFTKAGALLALLQRIRGSDFHFENIMACGDDPVLVDLETLFHPLGNPPRETALRSEMILKSAQSIFATHYAPMPCKEKEGPPMGGLQGNDDDEPHFDWRYEFPGSAEMRRGVHPVEADERQNLPVFEGRVLDPEDFVEPLVAGYKSYQRFLKKALDDLGDTDWLFKHFAGSELRFVRKQTRDYAQILNALRAPSALSNPAAFAEVLEPLLPETKHHEIRNAERTALSRFDIPKFVYRLGESQLTEYGTAISQDAMYPAEPWPRDWPVEAEADALGLSVDHRWVIDRVVRWQDAQQPLSLDEALVEAKRIGDMLLERGTMVEGAANWHYMGVAPGTKQLDIMPMDIDLYNGLAGPTIFLAALYRATGDDRYGDVAQAALRTISASLGEHGPEHIGGGFEGPLSAAYGMDLAAQLLGAPTPEAALKMALSVSPESLRADRGLDIISGLAGVILILLRLHARTGNAGFLDRAEIAGRILVEHADENEQGVWLPAGLDRPLAGFSHGASGFISALSALNKKRPSSRFDDVIEGAYRFEADVKAQAGGAWPDLRGEEELQSAPRVVQWCHGAAGVGLARLMCRDDMRGDADLKDALDLMTHAQGGHVDDLCCGVMGQVLILEQAGRVLDDGDLVHTARCRARACVEAANHTSSYRLFSGNDYYAPGLMKGLSGIGYTLLYMNASLELPNILALE